MRSHKRKPLPLGDGVEFIRKLEKEVSEGNADFIAQNLPKLERYISLYQDRIYQLVKFWGAGHLLSARGD